MESSQSQPIPGVDASEPLADTNAGRTGEKEAGEAEKINIV